MFLYARCYRVPRSIIISAFLFTFFMEIRLLTLNYNIVNILFQIHKKLSKKVSSCRVTYLTVVAFLPKCVQFSSNLAQHCRTQYFFRQFLKINKIKSFGRTSTNYITESFQVRKCVNFVSIFFKMKLCKHLSQVGHIVGVSPWCRFVENIQVQISKCQTMNYIMRQMCALLYFRSNTKSGQIQVLCANSCSIPFKEPTQKQWVEKIHLRQPSKNTR